MDFLCRLIRESSFWSWLIKVLGLGGLIDRLCGPECKSNTPPETCPISWQPSTLAPVFYGVRDYGPTEGRAPGPCRVFFPSLDGSPEYAPILDGCCKFPLIIFCHGHCSTDSEHYKKWYEIPAQLARSGYVVVVPDLPAVGSGTHPTQADGDLDLLGQTVDWMRSTWEHRLVLMDDPSTGILGHSYGALLAARYAESARVSAYGSLSGVWEDWSGSERPINRLEIPKLFTWGDPLLDLFTSLDGTWSAVPLTKHKVVFEGAAHWDYLRPGRTTCEGARGSCDIVNWIAGDIVVAFFGRYLPPECWPDLGNCIPPTLVAKLSGLTEEQQFFAGGHLMSWSMLPEREGCKVTLSWETPEATGSTTRP